MKRILYYTQGIKAMLFREKEVEFLVKKIGEQHRENLNIIDAIIIDVFPNISRSILLINYFNVFNPNIPILCRANFNPRTLETLISCGADEVIGLNKSPEEILFLVEKLILLKKKNSSIIDNVLNKHIRELIQAFVTAIDARDEYTANHSKKVALWAKKIGRLMGLTEDELLTVEYSALLHDVGYINLPRNIFRKDGELDLEDKKIIQSHTFEGQRIIQNVSCLKEISLYIRSHHERDDGSGYPDGLTGEHIPLISKIIAVADSFDAMITDRFYRPKYQPEEAAALLMKDAERKKYDKEMVSLLLKTLGYIK